MAKTRGNLATIAIVVSFVTLAGAAALGWWNFWNTRMVSTGDIREACYLAIAFDDYFEQNGKAPSQEDIESLPSRLKFLRIQDGHAPLIRVDLCKSVAYFFSHGYAQIHTDKTHICVSTVPICIFAWNCKYRVCWASMIVGYPVVYSSEQN